MSCEWNYNVNTIIIYSRQFGWIKTMYLSLTCSVQENNVICFLEQCVDLIYLSLISYLTDGTDSIFSYQGHFSKMQIKGETSPHAKGSANLENNGLSSKLLLPTFLQNCLHYCYCAAIIPFQCNSCYVKITGWYLLYAFISGQKKHSEL